MPVVLMSDDYHWTEVLMREAGRLMDGLSLHYYTVPGTWQNKGSATEFTKKNGLLTMKKTLYMEELITRSIPQSWISMILIRRVRLNC